VAACEARSQRRWVPAFAGTTAELNAGARRWVPAFAGTTAELNAGATRCVPAFAGTTSSSYESAAFNSQIMI